MNAMRQPHSSVMAVTMMGAMMAPTVVPELKIPVAKALSRFGNHSATTLTAAGKLPASPSPKTAREAQKPVTVREKACNTAPMLHTMMAIE